MSRFRDAAAAVRPLDHAAARRAAEHHDRLTKPRGALGRLERLGIQLAAISGQVPPPVPEPATIAVFAGDHGVHAEGVTPWPQDVTAQMVANFLAGGAAINVLARHAGADVVVVDVGVATPLDPAPGLYARNVAHGTRNLAVGPAMTVDEATAALDVGAEVAADLGANGARALVTGDMGIANTTPSAALIAAFTGHGAADVTGRGTGIDDAHLARKIAAIDRALARFAPNLLQFCAHAHGTAASSGGEDVVGVLAELGGLEIAALAGFVVGGAAARVPVVVDGVIALAGVVVAAALVPDVLGYCVPGHRSTEPGATAALAHLGLEPVLDLDLRLGEGTGACLALGLVQASAKILREMATFDSAGVTEKS